VHRKPPFFSPHFHTAVAPARRPNTLHESAREFLIFTDLYHLNLRSCNWGTPTRPRAARQKCETFKQQRNCNSAIPWLSPCSSRY